MSRLNAKLFVITIYAQKVLFQLFFKRSNISLTFSHSKTMNANYADLCMVSNLEADFQQVPPVQFFSASFIIFLWNINNLNSAKKS